MIQRCAWCGQDLGWTPGPDREITHGICPPCYESLLGSCTRISLHQALDRLEVPVFLMDDDARVVAANALAVRLVRDDVPVLDGARVGDVFECVRATLPGGCGKTDECAACVVRWTVEDTYATGRGHAHVRTCLQRTASAGGLADLELSTERVAQGVLVRIDAVTARGPRPAPAGDRASPSGEAAVGDLR